MMKGLNKWWYLSLLGTKCYIWLMLMYRGVIRGQLQLGLDLQRFYKLGLL